jgi:multidrug efflux pump
MSEAKSGGFNLSEWALKHRSITVYLMIIAVLAGLASFYRLGRGEDPTFIIKTMVVQAAWPGATMEETLKQVTERLERTLQETPNLDFLRSFTRAGVTTIFVNLDGKTNAQQVADTWYHVRKSIGDMRHTLAGGRHRPGLQRRIRRHLRHHLWRHRGWLQPPRAARHVESLRSKLLNVPDVSKIELLGAGRTVFIEFSMRNWPSSGSTGRNCWRHSRRRTRSARRA